MTQATIFNGLARHLDAGVFTGTPEIAWPDVPFTPTPGAAYLRANHLPNETEQVTLGSQGENRHIGIFQIDVMYPEGSGSDNPLRLADEIIAHFKRGTNINEGGLLIRVIAPPSVAPALLGDAFAQYPVTVEFQADAANP